MRTPTEGAGHDGHNKAGRLLAYAEGAVVIGLVRDELGAFLFWLAAKLEKKHKDAVIRYSEKSWSHMGKGAVSTRKGVRTWQIEADGSLTELDEGAA